MLFARVCMGVGAYLGEGPDAIRYTRNYTLRPTAHGIVDEQRVKARKMKSTRCSAESASKTLDSKWVRDVFARAAPKREKVMPQTVDLRLLVKYCCTGVRPNTC